MSGLLATVAKLLTKLAVTVAPVAFTLVSSNAVAAAAAAACCGDGVGAATLD